MKFLVVLVCFVAYTSALDKALVQKFIDQLYKTAEKCYGETSSSKADMDSMIVDKVFPTTHEAKCLVFCMHRQFHLQNDDGSINRDGAMASMQGLKIADEDLYNKIVPIMKNCADTVAVDSDPCEYAVKLGVCTVEAGKAAGLEPEFTL